MKKAFAWGVCLFLCLSCSQPPQKETPKEPSFERVPAGEVPDFSDDLNVDSLRAAIRKSLDYYDRVPGDRTYPLGGMQISVERLRATLTEFLRLLDTKNLDRDSIAKSFEIVRAYSLGGENKPLVSGYYEPILEGRLEATKEFCYPLYRIPPDLLTIDLTLFDPVRFSGQRLTGLLKDNRVVPYYSRSEIDGQKKLEQSGAALAWLKDPIDAFFLHVQGSGVIKLADGSSLRLGYAGSNGRPYRSIGKTLIDKGVMTHEEMSLQSIRAYLKAHPDVRDEVLWQNESYVFFRWIKEGPLGSLNVPLTTGRSIASDPLYHPRGALAFLVSQKPRLDANGEVLGWEPLQRWVLNQDTGGAIKGIGRVDLFCGSGETAEWTAGRLKHPGSLYFILKRERPE